MTAFAPTGNGRVLAYVFAAVEESLSYVRGTNIVVRDRKRYAADGDEIVEGPFDLPPLAGATRAALIDQVSGIADREGATALYARSVLVIALHQGVDGAFITDRGDEVRLAYALDVCGERGAAEAFYGWALNHRKLDGELLWGLGQHIRLAYGSELRTAYGRLKDGPGPDLAATPIELPSPSALVDLVARRNELDLITDEHGVDLAAHADFLIAVHAQIPKLIGGEDYFFSHQAQISQTRRRRALYGGAFHLGMTAAGVDPATEVEVRRDLEPVTIAIEPVPEARYKVRISSAAGDIWASDSIPRPGGQEFALSSDDGPPDWVHDAVVYQLMVDRFASDGGPLPRPGSSTALYGGTFDGVREHLDHIEALGCTVLWMTPVHQAPSHHGYDHEDFFTVESRYGGESALKSLIDAAHARGIRVLLDFVPNHTGRGHRLFRDAIAKGGDAAEFYRFWQWPHYYRCFYDNISLPELDTGNRMVQRYLVDAARHWLTEYGADGVRCDHVAGADPAFWIELRKGVRAVKPDALILGEATGDFALLGRYAGRLDAIFDFEFADVVRQTIARGVMTAEGLAHWMDDHDSALDGLARATLIDSHDMNRFLWMAGGDKRKLKLAATVLMTYVGMPVVYYGTEVGLSQRRDGITENAEARLPMLWGDEQDAELLEHFQRLGRLRRASPALRRGVRRTLSADADELVYERALDDERLVVTINVRTLRGSVVDGAGRDRLGEDDVLGVGPDQRPR